MKVGRRRFLSGVVAATGAGLSHGCGGKVGMGPGTSPAADGGAGPGRDAAAVGSGMDATNDTLSGATARDVSPRAPEDATAAADGTNDTAPLAGSLGIPGPFPGRVVSVRHPGSYSARLYRAQPITDMIRRGIVDLTGAPDWVAA